jgi:hypothetical protein
MVLACLIVILKEHITPDVFAVGLLLDLLAEKAFPMKDRGSTPIAHP